MSFLTRRRRKRLPRAATTRLSRLGGGCVCSWRIRRLQIRRGPLARSSGTTCGCAAIASGEPPPAWQVLDDFSSGLLTNWLYFALAEEGRSCQVTNGQFVQSCTNLPTSHTPSGCVMYREPLEISRTHTLEVQVDLVSARAPHPVVSLSLGHYVFDPFSAPDRPFIAHGRWLATTFWDAPIRIWDLEKARLGGGAGRGG